MLCDPPPANAEILPEASQGSYFFNRIGRFVPVVTGRNRHMIAGDDRLNPQWLHNVGLSEKAPMLRFRFSDTAGNGWPDFIFNEFGFISNEFRRRSSQGDIESP